MQNNQMIGNRDGVVAVLGTSSQNEVQTITGGATSGTFTLTFGTVATTTLNFNDSAATIQTALRAIPAIGATGVNCTGGPLNTTPVVCTFVGKLAGVDVPLLTMQSINLAGGTVTPSATTAPVVTAFNDTNLGTIAAARARLAVVDAATYTSAYLDKMTYNDMVYALRVADNPQTVR